MERPTSDAGPRNETLVPLLDRWPAGGRLVIGRWIVAAVAIGLLSGAVLLAGTFGAGRAADALRSQAMAALPLAAGTLTAEIEKQRLVPSILAQDEAVRAALRAGGRGALAALNAKLLSTCREASASVIYVVGADGIAIAASNAGEPTSFVGSDYRFRRYFSEAMAGGSASQYALGTVSGKPGLYLSSRVEENDATLGVVVLKVELDRMEASWRDSGFVVFTTDAQGIVLATSQPQWRFHTLSPLSAEAVAATREQIQLPDAAFEPLGLARDEAGLVAVQQSTFRKAVEVDQDLSATIPGWRLTLLAPADAALAGATDTARLVTVLALALAGSLTAIVLRRRRAARQRQEALSRMNAELEQRVVLRTAELTRSNTALADEMAERARAEDRMRRLRDDLAQANRLSILGQISAGVAHEINQPVAAIRTYAENAGRYLGDGKTALAESNLGSIVSLTERIGIITDTLRSFARRANTTVVAVPVEDAVDGALSLLSGRIRESGVTIQRSRRKASPMVLGGRIRLEQILVNLLQNALDALKDRSEPRIRIDLVESGETVLVTVADNGPGLDPRIAGGLFMPFQTSKEKGLGLGLVISQEIAREFGGDLRFEPAPGGGAAFTVDLRRAP